MRYSRLVVGICCMIIVSCPISVSHAGMQGQKNPVNHTTESSQIVPFWVGVIRATHDLEFIDGNATAWFKVRVNPDKVNKVNFSGYLQKKIDGRWTTVESWNETKTVSLVNASLEKKYDAQKGYQYQYFATIKAYKNTTLVDTIEVESGVKSY